MVWLKHLSFYLSNEVNAVLKLALFNPLGLFFKRGYDNASERSRLRGTCCRSDTPITRDLSVWGSSCPSIRCLTSQITAKQVGKEEVFPSNFLLDMALCCQVACQTKPFGPSKLTLFFFPWSLKVHEYCLCHVVLVRCSLQHKEKCWIIDCCKSTHC